MIPLLLLMGCVAGYSLFLWRCRAAWKKGQRNLAAVPHAFTSVSVLLPVRNESNSLQNTLSCLTTLDYPAKAVEFIVIDDHSDDDTVSVVEAFIKKFPELMITLLRSAESVGKKGALETGVRAAKHEIIVTTDGDVRFGSQWLWKLVEILQPGTLVCGPVLLKSAAQPTVLRRVVLLESIGLSMIAAAGIIQRSPYFCNGANMAFYKTDFERLGGYADASGQLTGDDTALLLKYPPERLSFAFHHDCTVTAEPAATLSEFVYQRQRWASKVPFTLTRSTLFAAILAWLAHAALLTALVACLSGLLAPVVLMAAVALKVVIEYVVLKAGGDFFRERISFIVLLAVQPIYWMAIVLIGLLAVFVPYRWKGRVSNT